MFFGKKILCAVTGGIAVYKAAEIVRELKKARADVRVVMTEAATRFVSPLTFEVLSGNPVLLSIFPAEGGLKTAHIDWARWPDVIVICPATANTIGKIAAGLADNALTTVIMATTAPVVFCPAMNKNMYANAFYRNNERTLIENHYVCVKPGEGDLACGETGAGRLAEKSEILYALHKVLFGKDDLIGKKFLVTASRTEEPLDPVRYLSNRSSGKMGFALAQRAALRGARVVLVSGPTALSCSDDIQLIRVRTAAEMASACAEHVADADIVIMAAAVSDYKPAAVSEQKIKKGQDHISMQLEKTQDILEHIGSQKGKRIHVGFSVETQHEIENSVQKLKKKNLDMIVINNPLEAGAGFEADTNKVTIVDRAGSSEQWPLLSKIEVADKILDRIKKL